MRRRSSRTSIAALSLFVAASLTAPAAYATSATSTGNAQDVPAALMCIDPGTAERLSQAVEEARARVTLADKELAAAQKALDEQTKAAEASTQKAAQARASITAALAALQEADSRALHNATTAVSIAQENEAHLRQQIQKTETEIAELDKQLAQAHALKDGDSPLHQEIENLAVERDTVAETQKNAEAQLVQLRAAQSGLEAAKEEALKALQPLQQTLDQRDTEVRDLQEKLVQAQLNLDVAKDRAQELENAGGEAGLKNRIAENSAQVTEQEKKRTEQQGIVRAAINEMDSFDETIAGLTKSIENTRAKILAAQTRVTDAEAQLVEEKKLLDVLKGFAEETQALVTADEAALQEAQQEVQRAQALVDEKQGALTQVSEQVTQLENKAQSGSLSDAEQQQLTALRQQKSALEGEVAGLREKLATAQGTVVSTEKRLANARKQHETSEQIVARNEQAILDRQNNIKELRAKAEQAASEGEKSIAATEKSIEGLNAQKARVQERKDGAEAQIEAINGQIKELTARKAADEALLQHFGGSDVDQKAQDAVATAQEGRDKAQEALAAKQTEREQAATAVAAQQEKITEATSAVKAGNDKIAEVDAARLKASARVAEIDGELPKKRDELREALAGVDAQISSLESRREALSDNLAASQALLDKQAVPGVQAAQEQLRVVQERHDLSKALTLDSVVAAPLTHPHFAQLEATAAPHRAVVAEAMAAEKERDARAAVRDRLAADLAKARESLASAEKALADARALPPCADDNNGGNNAGNNGGAAPQQPEVKPAPGTQRAPQNQSQTAGHQAGKPKATQPTHAQPKQKGGLAATGAEDISGVATLIAMLGAGAVITARARKR